jgi:hypothetical protein
MLWTKSEHNVVDAIWRDLFALLNLNATRWRGRCWPDGRSRACTLEQKGDRPRGAAGVIHAIRNGTTFPSRRNCRQLSSETHPTRRLPKK